MQFRKKVDRKQYNYLILFFTINVLAICCYMLKHLVSRQSIISQNVLLNVSTCKFICKFYIYFEKRLKTETIIMSKVTVFQYSAPLVGDINSKK